MEVRQGNPVWLFRRPRFVRLRRNTPAAGCGGPKAEPSCLTISDPRSPIKHHLVLHRIDPERGIRRFYSLMIERDLFGTVRLVRNWGRIGSNGQELVEIFDTIEAAGQALEAIVRAKRRRGYGDL
jgi:predicted DNA-binding WGR domain protein